MRGGVCVVVISYSERRSINTGHGVLKTKTINSPRVRWKESLTLSLTLEVDDFIRTFMYINYNINIIFNEL